MNKISQRLPAGLTLQFTETMRGHLGTGSPFEFVLTIRTDDLARMLSDADHAASISGTVTAPALSASPLAVREGRFNLFVDDPKLVNARRMLYAFAMHSDEGRTFYLEGFKTVRNEPGLDLWADTTTLHITVHEGADATGPVVGSGMLRILPADFLRQMTTIRVEGTDDPATRLQGVAAFGHSFAGTLFDVYGGVFARPTVFDPGAPPRTKRPLRVAAPEVSYVTASDGVALRLTRYRGGDKGPVILAHGLGVSSLIFAIDTIETNLLEYLYEHGYDVWLLDYRASIDLPASAGQFSADDIARRDYPAAVEAVLRQTGAKSVQMVVHCYGSTTFFMAMLAGLRGVRSVVSSQIATHVQVPALTKIKAGLHLPSFLKALGVPNLKAYVDANADWQDQLFDKALKVYPIPKEEVCRSPVCRRISFLYAPLYEHDQLNEATHNAMHELFGVANIRSFEHLALMVRAGRLVAADGSESYMPDPRSWLGRTWGALTGQQRPLGREAARSLAIPIAFIHGAENACYLPESTEATYDLLRRANGDSLYRRHVIPKYGHIDCIFGRDASRDVYPAMLDHLEATQQ